MREIMAAFLVMLAVSAVTAEPEFEKLGTPVRTSGLSVRACTEGPDGQWTAWGPHEAPDGHAIIGIDVATGESRRIGVNHYGRSHIQFSTGPEGEMYVYCGVPAHFF
ncbi:MAG: hypothetical protein ACOCX2_10795, partial [Armatimonadota bacterium]